MLINDLKDDINSSWNGSQIARFCIKIIDSLSETSADQLKHLTYHAFSNIVKSDTIDEELLAAVNVLVSSEFAILEIRWFFEEIEIETEEYIEAKNTGFLVHPETGTQIYDYESFLYPTFIPNDSFIDAIKSKGTLN